MVELIVVLLIFGTWTGLHYPAVKVPVFLGDLKLSTGLALSTDHGEQNTPVIGLAHFFHGFAFVSLHFFMGMSPYRSLAEGAECADTNRLTLEPQLHGIPPAHPASHRFFTGDISLLGTLAFCRTNLVRSHTGLTGRHSRLMSTSSVIHHKLSNGLRGLTNGGGVFPAANIPVDY